MILQRYTFGSKSQHNAISLDSVYSCLWYCKDIHLEANHNFNKIFNSAFKVAYDIAKIYIWKQITTLRKVLLCSWQLLMILQRYTFGSKSQHLYSKVITIVSCLWYCKDIHLEANHNPVDNRTEEQKVAYDIAKIYIWKQITTACGSNKPLPQVAYDIAKIGNFSQIATP